MTPARLEAGQRLRRLLAVLTWLARVQRAPVTELAERFAMTPEELVADLELAACCGLPPYTPDQLMEILVDEEQVEANLGPELARPRRLNAAEGFALAAAARAILDTPGSDADGALGRALAKLEAALGAGTGTSGLRVDLGEAPHLAEVRGAVDAGRQLLVRYYSMSSDEESERVIDPVALVATDGRWYLDAYCHRAKDMRRFRLDRLVSVAETGKKVRRRAEKHAPAGSDDRGAPAAFVPGPDATLATVLVDPDGMWLVEAMPTLEVRTRRDGRREVKLAVASRVWFERLLLRLGPHGRVLDPPELVDAGRAAAARLLERYAAAGAGAAV
jgi:proteasome accessory factor C